MKTKTKPKQDKLNLRPSGGFTIVELLIVIVVIGILAAISIVAYNGIQNRAHRAAINSDLANNAKVLESYNALNDSYPISLSELEVANLSISSDSTPYAVYCAGTIETNSAWALLIDLPDESAAYYSNSQQGSTLYEGDWGQYKFNPSDSDCSDIGLDTTNFGAYLIFDGEIQTDDTP